MPCLIILRMKFYIHVLHYAHKRAMFGCLKKDCTLEDYIDMVDAQFVSYMSEYMAEADKLEEM